MYVLIVEDEPIVAMDIESALIDAGFEVLGPVSSVAEAERHVDQADAAVLDINLSGETSAPIAAALTHRGRRFVILSSLSQPQTDGSWNNASAWLEKPMRLDQLIAEVRQCVAVEQSTTNRL